VLGQLMAMKKDWFAQDEGCGCPLEVSPIRKVREAIRKAERLGISSPLLPSQQTLKGGAVDRGDDSEFPIPQHQGG